MAAQDFPKECEASGLQSHYETFAMTAVLSMQEHICGEIAPDTLPSFQRVLARYRETAPSCYSATRASPQLVEYPSSLEVTTLISDYRSGVMSKERRDRLLRECQTIELTEKRRQDEHDALKGLFPKFPADPNG